MADDPLNMKSVIQALLSGWCLQHNMTEEEKDGMEDHSYFLPYCGNDPRAAECLYLFSYWSNDLLSVAADYGLTTEVIDGKFKVVDTPPRPSDRHWFDCGGYVWDNETQTQSWKPGEWREPLEEMPEGTYKVEVTAQ